ncbi:hypothetical protein GCM10025868_09040 [Angustibacter aerolatus]|uniref:Uncharacterized protein n=1 Tax=Angustibacter aerolatus TaxID=1162965 RepID=A0ABQ6JET7_9ACTN|nr:hypothetical protein [Angustibacter aerolatus]GMA85654.1 hypothetical protein GCM10025868_09040 [Angustibacter aerolatus]
MSDAVLGGQTDTALALLRHALATGLDPVPIVAVLALGLRSLAKVSAAGTVRSADAARDLGMAPWQVDKARRQPARLVGGRARRRHPGGRRSRPRRQGRTTRPGPPRRRPALRHRASRARRRCRSRAARLTPVAVRPGDGTLPAVRLSVGVCPRCADGGSARAADGAACT